MAKNKKTTTKKNKPSFTLGVITGILFFLLVAFLMKGSPAPPPVTTPSVVQQQEGLQNKNILMLRMTLLIKRFKLKFRCLRARS